MGDDRLRWLRGRRGFEVGLLLTVLLGSALRLTGFTESLAFDELYLHAWVHGHGFGRMLELVADNEKTPPLGFILSWATAHFGDSPELIRLPSLIAGIALIPATGLLGRRTVGKSAGLLGALLVAVSPFAVFYGTEARSYSLAAFLCVSSVLMLFKALDDGGTRWWVGWSLVCAAALMAHYTAVSLLLAVLIWSVVFHRDRLKPIAAAQLGPVIALLAWLPWLSTQVANSSDELHRIAAAAPLGAQTLGRLSQRLLIGHPLADWTRVPGRAATVAIIAGALIASVSLLLRAAKASSEKSFRSVHPETWLLVFMALAAPLAAILVSLQPGQSMLLPRNVMVALPAIALLLASAVTEAKRPFGAIAATLIVGGLFAGSLTELSSTGRPATARAAAVINRSWKPSDQVIDLCCLYGANGPLGRELAVNLDAGPRRALSVITADPGAWQRLLKRPARVFIVGYQATGGGPILFDNAPANWRRSYEEVSSRGWNGLLRTVLREYTPSGAGGR